MTLSNVSIYPDLVKDVRPEKVSATASSTNHLLPCQLVQLLEGGVGGGEDGELALLLGQHLGQVCLLQGGDEGSEVKVGGENIRDCPHSGNDDLVNNLDTRAVHSRSEIMSYYVLMI